MTFILRRLGSGALVLICVVVAVFIITRVVGDPLAAVLPLEATAEQRAAFAAQLGLDKSLWAQFLDYLGQLMRLDLGESLWQKRSVTEIFFERFPYTLVLVGVSMIFAVIMSSILGSIAATKPGSLADRVIVGVSLVGLSVPQFWLGLMLILVFAVQFKVLPTSGSEGIQYLIMPALSLALPAMARMVMVIRSAMMEELNAQYIRVQHAKGMPYWRAVGIHAFRNISAGLITLSGWEFIRNVAGLSVVVETLFAWPGIGMLAMQAVSRKDLTLLQGVVFYVAIFVIVFNIILDLCQKAVDPRVELV